MGRHSTRYPAEVRHRAVRLVLEHQRKYGSPWEAMCSIATKFGCPVEPPQRWARQGERYSGARLGLTRDDRERVAYLFGFKLAFASFLSSASNIGITLCKTTRAAFHPVRGGRPPLITAIADCNSSADFTNFSFSS